MRLVYYKILRFYEVVFKSNDADLYAYLASSALFSLNLMSLQMIFKLNTDPTSKVEPLVSICAIVIGFIVIYFYVFWKGKHQELTKKYFNPIVQGKMGGLLVLLYALGSVFCIIYLAFTLRQYHI